MSLNSPRDTDYFKTTLSLIIGTVTNLKAVSHAIIPYLSFVTAFGGFVLWNGGVVLGKQIEYFSISFYV